MKKQVFDYNKSDSQGTKLLPLDSHQFDLEAYSEYNAELNEGCQEFWKADSGVATSKCKKPEYELLINFPYEKIYHNASLIMPFSIFG